jgi:hypothetical protein
MTQTKSWIQSIELSLQTLDEKTQLSQAKKQMARQTLQW